jgi:uncharacterized membrane protein YgcG
MKPFLLAVVFLVALLPFASALAVDEGWVITSFAIRYTVNPDGTTDADEAIDVDFGFQQKHGIYRDLRSDIPCDSAGADVKAAFTCPDGSYRHYDYEDIRVTDDRGRSLGTSVSQEGEFKRIRIGDPSVTVSGVQHYRIRYRIIGALNPFTDHDEFFWNVSGTWPAKISAVTVQLVLPGTAQIDLLRCFNGPERSTAACPVTNGGSRATFSTNRILAAGEQVTIAAGWQKGVVAVPSPTIRKDKTVGDFFTLDLFEVAPTVVLAALAVAGVGRMWWKVGRDRRYQTLTYLTGDTTQETRPLFGHTDIVVEYLPPDNLRPAEMGVILDERADTLDVTATIIDLAVRGYLHITEIPKEGWFGHKDWTLTQTKEGDIELLPYESLLLDALFKGGKTDVPLSSLKKKFATDLQAVKRALYDDAMERKWFSGRPQSVMGIWIGMGIAVVVLGVLLSVGAGAVLARALLGTPVILAGVLVMLLSKSMVRRTAVGSEALRRVLGFRLYVDTAETHIQEFNEQQNIQDKFAKYLPFAIVFGCVEKWANAFAGLEEQAAQSTAGWYTGIGAFQIAAFTTGLGSFSSNVSSAISSTPGGSGGSGGAGFSGGGGGGGGGGSW